MPRIAHWFLLLFLAVLAGCPDSGTPRNLCANPALNCDDRDACTADTCDPALGCLNRRVSCDDRDACTIDSCQANSGCMHIAVECGDGNQCTADSCDQQMGCLNEDVSAACEDGNACTTDSCSPIAGCTHAALSCNDGNECTADGCAPEIGCNSSPAIDGTSCRSGLGRCKAGVCESLGCSSNSQCDDRNACTSDSCDTALGECANVENSARCDDGNACTKDSCAPATGCANEDVSGLCDDGDPCTLDSCAPATGCLKAPLADGTSCNGGTGECRDGVCLSLIRVEYEQDFESLDRMNTAALSEDGWVVYGNVFEAGTKVYLYGYGPFEAPNDGAAFCAVATDQGGPGQGQQQLSVYSDYKNADHALGRLVESIVYREREISSLDAGRTISFSFDAKRGNINDPGSELCPCTSTAVAFVKTLNPMTGYATTNFVSQDTTAVPASWGQFEVTLPIDSSLVGQLLQVGFSSTATRYQPSGNIYDNVKVSSAPTAP